MRIIKIIFTVTLLLVTNALLAKALILQSTGEAQLVNDGQFVQQQFTVSQDNAEDISIIKNMTVDLSDGRSYLLVPVGAHACQVGQILDKDVSASCEFALQIPAEPAQTINYTIQLSGIEVSAMGDVPTSGNYSGSFTVQPPAKANLNLSYQGANPVIAQVGVSKELTFILQNGSNVAVQLGALIDSIDSNIFSLVPGSDCEAAVLNVETKSSCQFVLSYLPEQAENKQAAVAIKAIDTVNQAVNSNAIMLNLKTDDSDRAVLKLVYQGENPVVISTDNDNPALEFTVVNMSKFAIKMKPFAFAVTDNTCANDKVLNEAKACSFNIMSNTIVGNQLQVLVSGVNTIDEKEVNSNSVDIKLDHQTPDTPLTLNYHGENPVTIYESGTNPMLTFTVSLTSDRDIIFRQFDFLTRNNTCVGLTLSKYGQRSCSFDVALSDIADSDFTASVHGVFQDDGKVANSNSKTVTINHYEVNVEPMRFSPAPQSRTSSNIFDYTLQNPTKKIMVLQVNGRDPQTGIGLSSGTSRGNVEIDSNYYKDSGYCLAHGGVHERKFVVPAESSCKIKIMAHCSSNPFQYSDSITDDCYFKNGTVIDTSRPISGRNYELELKNNTIGKVVKKFGFELTFNN